MPYSVQGRYFDLQASVEWVSAYQQGVEDMRDEIKEAISNMTMPQLMNTPHHNKTADDVAEALLDRHS